MISLEMDSRIYEHMLISSLRLSIISAAGTKAGRMDVLCNALNLTHSVNFKLFPSNHLKIIMT